MPTAGCRAPGVICVPEVQLPLPTFNTSVSPVTNHHVCAITDPRKRAILHFPPQSQKLPPPLRIPEPELYGPGFFTSYSYSRGKERTPSLPLEPGLPSLFQTLLRSTNPKQQQETHTNLTRKITIQKTIHLLVLWVFHLNISSNNFFLPSLYFFCLNEGPRNMQICKLLGKAVMLVITLHLILPKGKLTFKN